MGWRGQLGWWPTLPALPHPWTMGTMEKGGWCSCSSWAAQLVYSGWKSAQETKIDRTWVGNRWAHLPGCSCENKWAMQFLGLSVGGRGARWCLCWFLWRFMSLFCCRHGEDSDQRLEMRSFCDSSLWSSTPRKSLYGLRLVPTFVTHVVSSSSHDFRIQSHLFTCASHVCDCVFQVCVNNRWSILRSYDPHKSMCPKPSLSVPISYPTVWNKALHLLLLCIFSQENSDKAQHCRDFVLN